MSIDHGKLLALIHKAIAPHLTKRQQGRAMGAIREVFATAQPAEAVEGLTVENAPFGTRAPAFGGGYWHKVEHGWKWCTGSTFPRPGGDWTGELIPPAHDAAQGAVAPFAYGADLTPGDYDMEHSVWLLRPGESVPAGCTPLYTHPQAAPAQGDGVGLIAAERRRQVEAEGWTPEHDGEHAKDEMAMAGAAYAMPERHRMADSRDGVPQIWPWGTEWWKPGDRLRELTKAGALIAAEIDRLQRAAPSPEPHND